jgi:hypothetical protein
MVFIVPTKKSGRTAATQGQHPEGKEKAGEGGASSNQMRGIGLRETPERRSRAAISTVLSSEAVTTGTCMNQDADIIMKEDDQGKLCLDIYY